MSTLTTKNFKQLLAGKKTQLPRKASRELRDAGMGSLLGAKRINKTQAIRAINHLSEKKLLPKYASPSKVYGAALEKQKAAEAAALEMKKQKHVRANIELDIIEELGQEERHGDVLSPRYRAGGDQDKKQRVIDTIDETRRKREIEIQKEKEKRANPTGYKKSDKKKMVPVELPPDIDIG